MILPLTLIFLFTFIFLLFNELEDEVVRDRSKNDATWVVKLYSKIRIITLTNGANAKWYEPFEEYTGKYYPKFMKKPLYKERFIFSSTIFVFITDKEHWYQWVKLRFFTLTIASAGLLINWKYAVLVLVISQLGLFTLSFIKEAFIKKLN